MGKSRTRNRGTTVQLAADELQGIEVKETARLLSVGSLPGKKEQDLPALLLAPEALFEKVAQVDYNDGYDRSADAFAANARKRYIEADKAYYAAVKQNMVIHSGKRTVARQAELYVLYKWHGQGNPASWPGCSFHNWGLAADMVRTHEAQLVAAMKSQGWVRTVGDEGWHFECTGSAEHGKAATSIAALRKSSGLAYKWSEQVAHFYLKSRDFNKRAPVFNRRLEEHRATGQALQADIDRFNAAVTAYKARVAQFNRDVNHYNAELRRAKALVDEINSMPPGPARDAKIREFRRLEAWLSNESARLDRERTALNQEGDRLSRESSALDVRIAAFKKEDAWLTSEYAALTKIQKEIPAHKAKAQELLSKIESAVG